MLNLTALKKNKLNTSALGGRKPVGDFISQAPEQSFFQKLASKIPSALREPFVGTGQTVDLAGRTKFDTGLMGMFRPLGFGKSKEEKASDRIDLLSPLVAQGTITQERMNEIIKDVVTPKGIQAIPKGLPIDKLELTRPEKIALRPVRIEETLDQIFGVLDIFSFGTLKPISKSAAKLISKSKVSSEIISILKKEIPEISDEALPVFGRALMDIDDVNDVQRVMNRAELALKKAKQTAGKVDTTALKPVGFGKKDILPKDVSIIEESKLTGAKRISPENIKHQQVTPEASINTIKNDITSTIKILDNAPQMSSASKRVIDSFHSIEKKIKENKASDREVAWYNRAKDNMQIAIANDNLKKILGSDKLKYGKDNLELIKKLMLDDSYINNKYIDLVKKDISKGYKFPEEVLNYDKSFKTAINNRERYEKGLRTSFGADDQRIVFEDIETIGAGMKRQDGKELTDLQKSDIREGVIDFSETLGLDMRKLAKDDRWVYVHLNEKNPFLMKDVAGLYRKDITNKSVSVSVGGKEGYYVIVNGEKVKKFTNTTMAHELGHAIDFKIGEKFLSGDEFLTLRRNYNKVENSYRGEKYWSSKKEVTARMIEEYIAVTKGNKNFFDKQGYWKKDIFEKDIKPVVESNIKEKFSEYKLQPKPTTTLQQEAKKFKSVDEFIEAQPKVYHGSLEGRVTKLEDKPFFVSPDKNMARSYGKEISNFYLKDGKKADLQDVELLKKVVGIENYNKGESIFKKLNIQTQEKVLKNNLSGLKRDFLSKSDESLLSDYLFVEKPTNTAVVFRQKQIQDKLKKLGFDYYENRTGYGDTDFGASYMGSQKPEIIVLNKDILKTKSQLKDIYNKAKGVKEVPSKKPQVKETKQIGSKPKKDVSVEKIKEKFSEYKLQPKPTTTLQQEAKKFKSADEFIEAQPKLFHGTSAEFDTLKSTQQLRNKTGDFQPSNIGGNSPFIHITEDINLANSYSKARVLNMGGKANTMEVYIDGKILDKTRNLSTNFGTMERGGKEILEEMKEGGFVGVKFRDKGNYGQDVNTLAVLPDAVKTKSQLKDIYNKARGVTEVPSKKPQVKETKPVGSKPKKDVSAEIPKDSPSLVKKDTVKKELSKVKVETAKIEKLPPADTTQTIPNNWRGEFVLPKETKLQSVRRVAEDFNIRLKVLNDKIEEVAGSKIEEHLNLWVQKDMLPRKQSDLLRRVRDKKQDFVKRLTENDVDIEEFDKYLHANHAIERNKQMNLLRTEKGKEAIDGLSGMTDKEAKSILAKDNKQYESFTKEIQKMNDETLKFQLDQGLLKPKEYETIKGMYKDYVPLFRDVENDFIGIGQGIDIKGKEIKRAKGSVERRVVSPVGNVFFQAEKAQVRALKNEVGKTIIDLTKTHPETKDIFKIEKQQYSPRYNSDGELLYLDPKTKLGDNVIGTKIEGTQHFITIKDPKLAQALKNLNIARIPKGMQFLRSALGIWGSFKTRWRPEFLLTNFQRDLGEALLNLGVEKSWLKTKGKGLRTSIVKDLFPSQKAVWKYLRGSENKQVDEFFTLGGDAGHFWLDDINTAEKSLIHLQKEIQNVGIEKLKNPIRKLGQLTDDVNSMVELGVRYSTYKNLVVRGFSKEKAIQSSADLTVNFSRQGEFSPFLKSFYGFINPTIQGGSKVIRSLSSKEGGKSVLKGVVFLTALGFMTRMMSI